MSLYEDFNNGSKAYYDEVPRYKNPYEVSSHFDDSNHAAWEKGWDKACEEHTIFTENQTLKAEKQELFIERAEALEEGMFLSNDVARLKEQLEVQKLELEGDIQFANECVERFKEDAKNFASAFKYQCKDVDNLESQTVEVSTLLRDAYRYGIDSSIFSFRREKMIEYLKSMRVKVDALKESFPEKLVKSEKDA